MTVHAKYQYIILDEMYYIYGTNDYNVAQQVCVDGYMVFDINTGETLTFGCDNIKEFIPDGH